MPSSLIRVVKTVSGRLGIARKCAFSTKSPHHAIQRCLGQPTFATHPFLMKQDEVTPGLSKENYNDRRRRLVELILNEKNEKAAGKHLIVLLSSPVNYMTQDIPYIFHQNTNFLYLTGFLEPDSCLVLEVQGNVDGKHCHSHLFVPKRDPMKELWNGPRAGTDGALNHTGVDQTDNIENLSNFLKNSFSEDMTIWYDYTRMNNLPLHLGQIREFLQEAHKKGVKIRQIEDPLHEQRHIKTPEECELMSKASDIISEAFVTAMSSSRTGMNESEIHARLECSARLNGAQMLAFPPVVAGGSRANTLHYVLNNQKIDDGSLVLVDAGAYYHGYASDVTRTWPISGRFSEPQKLLYEAVLRTQRLCITLCRPGHSLEQIYQTMSMALGRELYDIGAFKDKMKMSQLNDIVRKFCPHHVGHWLGMDVHDTPGINRSMNLLPGMVVTIEPGLYIATDEVRVDPAFRGIGIRIEDDILITAGDPVVLSDNCPKEVADIEEIVSSRCS